MRDEAEAGARAERVLLIKAKGGLGNRILSATTGLLWAELSGRTPVIDWRDGVYAPPGTNAYPLLFEAPPGLAPEDLSDRTDVAPAVWRGELDAHPMDLIFRYDPKRHSDPFVYRKYCVDLSRADTDARVAVYWSYLPKHARLRPLLQRDPRFAGVSEDALITERLARWFTPNARIRTAVDMLITPETRPVIGVHVRYTDLKVPLERIEATLGRALAETPGARIFLATDNAEVEARLRDRFEGVFTAPKRFAEAGGLLHRHYVGEAPPEVTANAESALVDMWALARCDRLIYASRSTFSIVSRLVGGMGPERAFDVDHRNLKVRLKQFVQRHA